MDMRGRRRRYDWQTIFRRDRFTLRKGVDYDCTTSAIIQQIRNAASANGMRVAPVDGGDFVTVIVLRRPNAGTDRPKAKV